MSLKYSKLGYYSIVNQNDLSKVHYQQKINAVYHKESFKVTEVDTTVISIAYERHYSTSVTIKAGL